MKTGPTFKSDVAKSVPFDNSTDGFVSDNVQAAIEEVRTMPGSGVTPGFIFSRSGACVVGAYMYIGQVVSNKTGMDMAGSNKIVKITVSNSTTVGSNTTVQIQQRTGLSTFADIVGASVIVLAGGFRVSTVLAVPISIGPDWEISCYNKSGSTLTDPVVTVYLVPV